MNKNKKKGVGAALTRKLGPLPAWAWALIAFAGVYYYRNRLSQASGTGTGSVGVTPATPQSGQVLEPGESYYDPNTGQLYTAPGGSGVSDTAGGTTTGDGTGTTGATGAQGPPGTPAQQVGGNFKQLFPTAAKQLATVESQNRTILALLKKLNKRTPKQKNQHKQTKKVTPKVKAGARVRARSSASVKNRAGGASRVKRIGRASDVTVRSRAVTPQATTARTLSTRRTTPVVSQPVVRQRPVANATPHTAPRATTQHRPSAPQTRTARRSARQPARRR